MQSDLRMRDNAKVVVSPLWGAVKIIVDTIIPRCDSSKKRDSGTNLLFDIPKGKQV